MPAIPINTSPNISSWDSKIIANTCTGLFYIDGTPSVWIGGGAANVLGAKVQITNPYGVIIKPFGSSYDIPAPITAIYEYTIPTQAGTQQPGNYIIALQLTDADGTTYTVTKTVNVCSYAESKKNCEGLISAVGNCQDGKLVIGIADPPPFRGVYYQSRTLTGTVDYPTASGVAQLAFTVPSFSIQLYEGVYKISVTYCATYNMGDNIFIALGQNVVVEKDIKCVLDYTCIYPRLEQLNNELDSNCSERQREKTTAIILDALRLITTANIAINAGEDPSKYIVELEKLLGCSCSCDCNNLPIINNSPSTDIVVEGCNVGSSTVGLTTVYTINNYSYIVEVNPAQSYISISAPEQDGCAMTQVISLNIANVYAGIKTQISNTTEYNYWASVINNPLSDVDGTCLGFTQEQWASLTFAEKVAAIIQKACNGGSCAASISGVSSSQVGSSVLLEWTQTGGYAADVFVDGVYIGSVLEGVNELLLPNKSDGEEHDYLVIPKCTNGSNGTSASGDFIYMNCPSISPPSLSQSVVNDAACPYDLTSLESAPPVGITIEWHNANNTNSSSLVGDPTSVSSGVYYAFAKDANGCFSTSSQVTLICAAETSCTAPQSLLVSRVGGDFGYNIVSFASAAYPPPSNSYTVKRKLASDPDVDGSYTTIGTPTFNTLLNKWIINDNTATDNILYTYKAISNCSSSSPAILYNYAYLQCPSLTVTPATNSLGYSFVPLTGGAVTKYEVRLYDSTGVTQLQLHTILPSFSNPITGTFTYLTPGTQYYIEVKSFIDTFSNTCAKAGYTTSSSTNYSLTGGFNFSIDSVSGSGIPSLAPTGVSGTVAGTQSGMSGTYGVTVSGAIVVPTVLRAYVNSSLVDCVAVSGPGTFNLTIAASGSDNVQIFVSSGPC